MISKMWNPIDDWSSTRIVAVAGRFAQSVGDDGAGSDLGATELLIISGIPVGLAAFIGAMFVRRSRPTARSQRTECRADEEQG